MDFSSDNDLSLEDECTEVDIEVEPGVFFTRLNEMVRKQYIDFLMKQLGENLLAWCRSANRSQQEHYIQSCAKMLEDKAVKSCMMVQIYRKVMVKIIANIRRCTEQRRLQYHLRKTIENHKIIKNAVIYESKSTQTELHIEPEMNDHYLLSASCAMHPSDNTLRSDERRTRKMARHAKRKRHLLPTDNLRSNVSSEMKSISCGEQSTAMRQDERKFKGDNEDENDSDAVAQEMAQLFHEEKNEIDEIFGYNGRGEPDDPQINSILKEIAKSSRRAKTPPCPDDNGQQLALVLCETPAANTQKPPQLPPSKTAQSTIAEVIDMRNSLWPCELYMQRRKLSEILSRLVDEDMRWTDIMKWKFTEYFGDDSDDEFAAVSPTIELDEVLLCSCIKRISPWVVKHLMTPMKEGLIANRFLFKKLAKNLSRQIILENQYPDERTIKNVIENFFCIRQAVLRPEDLAIPMILYNDHF